MLKSRSDVIPFSSPRFDRTARFFPTVSQDSPSSKWARRPPIYKWVDNWNLVCRLANSCDLPAPTLEMWYTHFPYLLGGFRFMVGATRWQSFVVHGLGLHTLGFSRRALALLCNWSFVVQWLKVAYSGKDMLHFLGELLHFCASSILLTAVTSLWRAVNLVKSLWCSFGGSLSVVCMVQKFRWDSTINLFPVCQ